MSSRAKWEVNLVVFNESAISSNKKQSRHGGEDASVFFVRAKKRADRLTDTTAAEDQWYFLSVSYGIVVSFVFRFKTSHVRTPETSEDYCKLSSGDVFGRVGGGRRAGMRALHSPVPNCSKNKEKYHMGCSDHLKIHHQRWLLTYSQFSLPHFSDALLFHDYIFLKVSQSG